MDREQPYAEDEDEFDEEGRQRIEFHDYRRLKLKDDHEKRPIWISPDNKIFLEAFSPIQGDATDFLIAIAEPVSRPTYIHEYVLTPYSLYAAVSVGLTKESIFNALEKFSKNAEIPQDVKHYIDNYTSSYGKASLVLRENRYFIEIKDKRTKKKLRELVEVEKAYQNCIEYNRQQEE